MHTLHAYVSNKQQQQKKEASDVTMDVEVAMCFE